MDKEEQWEEQHDQGSMLKGLESFVKPMQAFNNLLSMHEVHLAEQWVRPIGTPARFGSPH
eukprot:1157718-Pelagomonas_calceolata.AAC.15